MQEKIFGEIGRNGNFITSVTTEESDAADQRLKQLTADYLTEKIGLEEYLVETDKLPKLDLRKLAQELKWH